jgi:hypothetical protein
MRRYNSNSKATYQNVLYPVIRWTKPGLADYHACPHIFDTPQFKTKRKHPLRRQLPVICGWAITCHRSQGMGEYVRFSS